MELKVFSNRAEASDAAAQFIAVNVRSILTNAPEVLVAIPGGSTPRACLTLLGQQDLPWQSIAVTLTDERDVPRDHPDSNFGLLRDTVFAGQALTERFVPLNDDAVTRTQHLPLVTLLGMGEDGHFASIFPDVAERDTLLDVGAEHLLASVTTGSSPHPRFTLTMARLAHAVATGLLIFGDTKRSVLEAPASLPVSHLVQAMDDRLTVFWAP
jgi:6-phosphogluconolactonase